MKRSILLVQTVVVAVALFGKNTESSSTPNSYAPCAPRLTLVQVDKEHPGTYYPYFVQVKRCGGTCNLHPDIQNCFPTSSEDVKIPLLDFHTNNAAILKFKSHTACGCGCVHSSDDCNLEFEKWDKYACRCVCQYPKGPPKDKPCKAGYRWDGIWCRCMKKDRS